MNTNGTLTIITGEIESPSNNTNLFVWLWNNKPYTSEN